jgi:ABC-2 type transport system ATP-binding protein
VTSPAGAPAISVRGLRKTYDGHTFAVDGIDLEIPTGEVFALLGPNGAGKTTVVEILEGYRTRTAGDVQVLGMDPAHGGRRLRQRIGIVLQECGIEPYLSVREVLRMRAPLYPHPRQVDEVIDLVGLNDKRTARVRTLSGGQKRRLDLALALIGDPELIFLDEPTTGFDPSARRASWEIIRSLCSLGKTVLLTTHYMDEAQSLASHVVIINGGKVVARGTPEDIGGRQRSTALIAFDVPQGVDLADLPLHVAVEGGRAVAEVEPPVTPTLHQLTAWAVEREIELTGLTVTRPSLEDVYLRLTGGIEAAEEAVGGPAPGRSS